MRKTIFLLVLAIAFVCCKKEEKPKLAETGVEKDIYADFYGNWVGDFKVTASDSTAKGDDYVYSNKLNLVIKKIEGNKIFGQSIVAGNSRPLIGDLKTKNGGVSFVLKEPGDNRNDGRFEFIVLSDTIIGKWFVNNKKAAVWEREFKLTKQPFKYNPKLMLPEEGEYVDWYSVRIDSAEYENEDGSKDMDYSEMYRVASNVITKLNASTKLLTENDVKNLKKLELEIIRNTIFARHGYTFKKKSFRQFFDPVDWYIPITDDMSGKLTPVEQKNIVLLNRFQKYAEDNYDSFGR
ncbi:YARHG domain-containing protein [Flavobacterium wongokense]|uniref:YARHG domain-containing protein n=1 Tax=Flavobacterium wongokense TaxID=2910674 RepID=UPI001F1DBB95|nr:YARHG domain-containing protein [Flavobacterium sp. WG47]MCF6132044.1 YARHG domain-containing protein [Flavobacterium sp. WG47]